MMVVPAGRVGRRTGLDRDGFMSVLASMLSGKKGLRWTAAGQQRLTVNLPIWFPADDPQGSLRLNGESRAHPFSPTHPTMLLILPQTQNRMLTEETVINVHPLCHPALRERTLRRLTESGGLQQLIDQWGDSSLEELEAFIDSYFQMVWEQTMGSFQPATPDSPASEQDAAVGEAREEEVLSSIDRKLSKLELLEEIRSDLVKLRESLENSWKAIQELRDRSKQDPSNTC
ncbi:GTPase IMAP family member 8-like protein [Lates japonicus]|uniref:GTPase IMAP family member 8-like protein n=1 Tax=Lates japonicus TaxID=270547 RepID=A0AAD3M884_LATJO|nr:GTPase IMAP family member 8-like protein [Lates japonicus]